MPADEKIRGVIRYVYPLIYLRGTDAIKLATKFVRTKFPSQAFLRSTVDEKK